MSFFSEADLRFIFANGYKMSGSARGPQQSYPNESNVEEMHKKKEKEKVMVIRNTCL